MKLFPIILIVFGVIVIKFPDIISYLFGGLLIFIGVNMIIIGYSFSKKKKGGEDSYVKFGNYKIYR